MFIVKSHEAGGLADKSTEEWSQTEVRLCVLAPGNSPGPAVHQSFAIGKNPFPPPGVGGDPCLQIPS